ncbi:hypothetical protein BJG88_04800 [Staphylococcus nepalensis]|uniref:Panacea domain-containing protein n=1 Tax=Staphylococcus nepalensis TaxID=214473 RepID=UPI000D5A2E63|nr:type II toxin-antitoxin system antitoxin SocA domain-containing protein [Staphylococcus nepalensis]AWI44134.1 hypothetical protein BJG88_04800 [Staphylococcus nepalensis]
MVKQYILFLENAETEDHSEVRIAFHKTIESKKDMDLIKGYKEKLQSFDVKYYSHLVTTSKATLSSLKEKDDFFENVHYYSDFQEFLTIAKHTSILKAMDVARYILLLKPTSPLKLQKLLYICYERFYEKKGHFMFNDRFLAYEYGPVVEDVYQNYKGRRDILKLEDDKTIYSITNESFNPIVYRLSRVSYGEEIKKIVKETVEYYSKYSAGDMVRKTHELGTAWSIANNKGRNTEITEDIILKAKPTK